MFYLFREDGVDYDLLLRSLGTCRQSPVVRKEGSGGPRDSFRQSEAGEGHMTRGLVSEHGQNEKIFPVRLSLEGVRMGVSTCVSPGPTVKEDPRLETKYEDEQLRLGPFGVSLFGRGTRNEAPSSR